MLDLVCIPALVTVAPVDMVARLGDLRREFELSGEWPEIEVDAALFLSDVCRALGMSDDDRRTVLGVNGAAYVDTAETERPTIDLLEE